MGVEPDKRKKVA